MCFFLTQNTQNLGKREATLFSHAEYAEIADSTKSILGGAKRRGTWVFGIPPAPLCKGGSAKRVYSPYLKSHGVTADIRQG